MAGRKITRRDYKKLNKVGEDRIFDSYVDEGSVEGMLRKLEPEIGVITTGTFYRWLKSDKSGSPNRWEKWQLNMKANAFMLAEEALRKKAISGVAPSPSQESHPPPVEIKGIIPTTLPPRGACAP